MHSMYARYLTEKTDDKIIETDKGFATYRYLTETKQVYIVDLYVLPDFRNKNVASDIADMIVMEARQKGCTELLGSVVPSNKGSDMSMKVLLAYGMTPKSSNDNFIIFRKAI